MSISAITAGRQKCKANIKWLHQSLVLDEKDGAFCTLELITEVSKGNLRFLELYFPFKISNLENKTSKLLDKNNVRFYTEGFAVTSINQKTQNCGEILLEKIKANVEDITLENAMTVLGSKININFPKLVQSGERRAVRIQFDCEDLSTKESTDKRSVTLSYYDFNDAKFLKLEDAVPVHDLFVWVVLPYGVSSVSNITPHFSQQRTWDKLNLKLMEPFYGERTKAIWSKLPRTFGMWEKHAVDKEPALRAWKSVYLHCDYAIQEAKSKRERAEEKGRYVIYTNEKKFTVSEEMAEDYRCKKGEFGLFVEANRADVFVFGKLVDDLKKAFMQYSLLIYFLKNKGVGGRYNEIFDSVWKPEKSIVDDEEGVVKQANYRLNQFLKKYKLKEITRKNRVYRLSKDLNFCLIEEKS